MHHRRTSIPLIERSIGYTPKTERGRETREGFPPVRAVCGSNRDIVFLSTIRNVENFLPYRRNSIQLRYDGSLILNENNRANKNMKRKCNLRKIDILQNSI